MSDTKIDRTLGSGQQWCFPLSFLGGRAGVMNVGPRGICSQRDFLPTRRADPGTMDYTTGIIEVTYHMGLCSSHRMCLRLLQYS